MGPQVELIVFRITLVHVAALGGISAILEYLIKPKKVVAPYKSHWLCLLRCETQTPLCPEPAASLFSPSRPSFHLPLTNAIVLSKGTCNRKKRVSTNYNHVARELELPSRCGA